MRIVRTAAPPRRRRARPDARAAHDRASAHLSRHLSAARPVHGGRAFWRRMVPAPRRRSELSRVARRRPRRAGLSGGRGVAAIGGRATVGVLDGVAIRCSRIPERRNRAGTLSGRGAAVLPPPRNRLSSRGASCPAIRNGRGAGGRPWRSTIMRGVDARHASTWRSARAIRQRSRGFGNDPRQPALSPPPRSVPDPVLRQAGVEHEARNRRSGIFPTQTAGAISHQQLQPLLMGLGLGTGQKAQKLASRYRERKGTRGHSRRRSSQIQQFAPGVISGATDIGQAGSAARRSKP